jgi:hypothetical protein
LVISLSSTMWDEEVDEDSGKHHQLKTEAWLRLLTWFRFIVDLIAFLPWSKHPHCAVLINDQAKLSATKCIHDRGGHKGTPRHSFQALVDTLSHSQEPTTEPSLPDFVLLGAWQGMWLYYVLMEFPSLSFIVAFAISAKLLVEFTCPGHWEWHWEWYSLMSFWKTGLPVNLEGQRDHLWNNDHGQLHSHGAEAEIKDSWRDWDWPWTSESHADIKAPSLDLTSTQHTLLFIKRSLPWYVCVHVHRDLCLFFCFCFLVKMG